ncbi:AtpZ/AtpI family protein [Geothermobacter hydrogeniphilus]|uniref:Magnesium transporter n=1 Tax=Geothermobacter hydrogeniphilus TaxID=1969733 RepID=A0A1X0Y6C0_9BACT|nr:AtpZ/AtpI family protein [Geothermobacter hydrogeniphilus]ORJ60668.1 magnesium transporter [Geothermobacter hydrogeniphilus]
MGEDRRQLIRSLGFLSSVGISLVAACLIGLALGHYLDKWLDTTPWMTLTWLGIGIIAGFRNVYILTQRELRRQKQGEDDQDNDES